jgi:hypothetical protein
VIEPARAAQLPRIHPAAWHGPIGEVVSRVAPVTEADPVALLASCLALFGAMAGDGSYVRVGGMAHPPRLWPLIVGKTGSGRKGTSYAEAKNAARSWSAYAHSYITNRITTGLASGEGLISSLGGNTPNAGPTDDPDRQPIAPDGKLTVVETEFARVLAAAKRDGSTLGPILRQLWDDSEVAIMTRAAPLSVKGAHLTVIAHVTHRELRLRLAESDLAGGTLNRFLLIASERPHLLAHELEHPDLGEPARAIGKLLDHCRVAGGHLMHRDRAAEALWPEVYAALCHEEPDGQLGSVLARGPAYTMRLALTYALADGDGSVRPDHLLAGLAVWRYAVASAKLVFPEAKSVGTQLEDFLVAAGDAGRTRTEISAQFGRNRPAGELNAMLEEMELHRRVALTKEGRDGAGRPALRYRWIAGARDPMGDLLLKYWDRRKNE